MATWTTPKTDWKATDCVHYWDYNRIKNNLYYLRDWGRRFWSDMPVHFSWTQNGTRPDPLAADITNYSTFYTASNWNRIEMALSEISRAAKVFTYANQQKTFADNGLFVDFNELNRIESATLRIYGVFRNQENNIRHLKFSLGVLNGGHL